MKTLIEERIAPGNTTRMKTVDFMFFVFALAFHCHATNGNFLEKFEVPEEAKINFLSKSEQKICKWAKGKRWILPFCCRELKLI
jgi:hypothetical protein